MKYFKVIKDNPAVHIYIKSIALKILTVLIGFMNTILINRSLGVALRGEYTTILTWASLFQLFLNLGIGTTYPAFKRKYKFSSKKVFFSIICFISSIYLVLLLLFSAWLSINLLLIVLLAIVLSVENMMIFIAIVEDVSKRNLINVFTSLANTALLIIIFVFKPYELTLIIFSVLCNSISLIILIKKYFGLRFSALCVSVGILKRILKSSLSAMFMNLLMYLNYHTNVLALSYMSVDNVQIGLYGTAVTLGNMLWILPDAFKDVLYNRVSKKDNSTEVLYAIAINIVICIFILFIFLFIGKHFLYYMYGSGFVDAYPLVLLLFIGTMPMVLYKLIHPSYIANGKTIVVITFLMFSVILNLFLNITLIPKYEAFGAAASTVISYTVCGIAFLTKFIYDYKINFSNLIKKIKSD